jgi:hypothetical protein
MTSRLDRRARLAMSAVVVLGGAVAARTLWAVHDVKTAREFNVGGMFGPSTEALDFNWLLLQPGAEQIFRDLVEGGTPASRIYGACGLQLIGSPHYRSAVDALSRDESEFVDVMGCFISHETVKGFVTSRLPRYCHGLKLKPRIFALLELLRLVPS